MSASLRKPIPAIVFLIPAFILLLIAYTPALRSAYIWDDDLWVTRNTTLHTLHGLKQIWTDIDHPTEY